MQKIDSVPCLTITEHRGGVSQCQSLKAKTVSASHSLIKQKHKNFEDESASCVFSFPPIKNISPSSRKGIESKFFHLYSFSGE